MGTKRGRLPALLSGGNLRVVKDLRTSKVRIGTDLEEREIYAIGYVTVQWAHLEHMLLLDTILLSGKLRGDVMESATSLSFKRRLRAWHDLIMRLRKSARRTKLLRLHGTIANAESKRHKITHGLWDWEVSNPDRIRASSFRKPHIFEQHFDFDKLIALGDSIGEILFNLHYPKGLKPAHMLTSYMSRDCVRMLTGRVSPAIGTTK